MWLEDLASFAMALLLDDEETSLSSILKGEEATAATLEQLEEERDPGSPNSTHLLTLPETPQIDLNLEEFHLRGDLDVELYIRAMLAAVTSAVNGKLHKDLMLLLLKSY